MSTDKVHSCCHKVENYLKGLDSNTKTTFNWKHFTINRIKNGSFETHRHSLKMNWFRNEHWWNVQCFQNLLYQLSNELISNHDTLLLLISAVDLRSINPSAYAFERMVSCSSQLTCWSRCLSRSHCKPQMVESLWTSVLTVSYSSNCSKNSGILYSVVVSQASGRS